MIEDKPYEEFKNYKGTEKFFITEWKKKVRPNLRDCIQNRLCLNATVSYRDLHRVHKWSCMAMFKDVNIPTFLLSLLGTKNQKNLLFTGQKV